MKTTLKYLVITALVLAGNANAALINFTITGDVLIAENYGGLVAFGSTITADITLDDTGLTGIGTEQIFFTGLNTLDITAGTLSFNQSMDGSGNTSITFVDGSLFDLHFGAQFGVLGAPEDFLSSLTSATASRSVTTGKGGNIVTTNHTLYATWQATALPLTPVPVPAAIWLFGSGLLGLAGIARRKSA